MAINDYGEGNRTKPIIARLRTVVPTIMTTVESTTTESTTTAETPTASGRSSNAGVIAGALVAVIVFVIVLLLVFYFVRRRRKRLRQESIRVSTMHCRGSQSNGQHCHHPQHSVHIKFDNFKVSC